MKYSLDQVDSLNEVQAAEEYVEYRLRENLTLDEIDYVNKLQERLMKINDYLPGGNRPVGYFARLLKKGAVQRGLVEPEDEIPNPEKICSCSARDLFNFGCKCGGR